jgi:outer membrane protein assembly factor BamB
MRPSPAIGADQIIHCAARGFVYAFATDGSVVSKEMLGRDPHFPAVADDGSVIGLGDMLIVAKPDAKPQRFGVGLAAAPTPPALGRGGEIYFARDQSLVAIYGDRRDHNSNGLFNRVGTRRFSAVSLGADGILYAGANARLYAIDPGGAERWSAQLPAPASTPPAIGRDGTLYVGTRAGLSALSSQGAMLFEIRTPPAATPAIDREGTVYFGDGEGFVRALTGSGQHRWTFRTNGPIRSAPAIAKDGTVYVGSADGRLYAIRPGGAIKWSFVTRGEVFSPTILPDGVVVFQSIDGMLRAVADGNGGLDMQAPWPKWAADLANTARAAP